MFAAGGTTRVRAWCHSSLRDALTNRFDPSVLWETRPEYKVFPLKVFRDHIYQEDRSKTGSSYWMNRSNKKKDS
jgi:hypothetical protein